MNSSARFLQLLAAGYSECGCADPKTGLLLAVSGGADSMALLHATSQLWPDHHDRIVVAHVNHCLRGEQSEADARFVEQAAAALGISCQIVTCDVREDQQREGGSTEEVARRLRYSALQQLADQLGCRNVVCAHHQNDQAETVLHNILRGTGLRGLGGMLRQRSLSESVRLIRPMLQISRTAIDGYLREQQRDCRIDDSNASAEFTRNRIRRQLLPLLAEDYNPQIVAGLVRLAEHAQDAESLIEQVAERCLEDVVLELQPGVCRLNRERLAVWPVSAVRAMLRRIWTQQLWPQQAMTQAHWQQLADSLHTSDAPIADVPGVEISATSRMIRIFRSS